MNASSHGPTNARIVELDVVRGIALLGVLTMNIIHGFRWPLSYARGVAPEEHLSGADRALDGFLFITFSDKAMTLFSALFGVGLAMFLERAERAGDGMTLLVRRLLILFGFGLIHSLFVWEGDILLPYSVAGFLALACIRAPRWALLLLALLLPAVFPVMLWRWPWLFPQGTASAVSQYQEALATYGHGSYAQVVALRVPRVLGVRAHFLAVRGLAQITGNIIFGIFLWRSGFLRNAEQYRKYLPWVAIGGIAIGAGYAVCRVLIEHTALPVPSPLLRGLWNITLIPFACGYGAALLILLRLPISRCPMLLLAPAGRMAFSNYCAQSLVLTTVFYGYGFGLQGAFGIVELVLIAVTLYAAQVVVSAHWLSKFRYGPLEWVWRSLTYGRCQPLSHKTMMQ